LCSRPYLRLTLVCGVSSPDGRDPPAVTHAYESNIFVPPATKA